MVGVPRSTGCAVCVRRHLKCDETKPHCLRCQKAKRSCPGYTKELIFKESKLGASKAKKHSHDRIPSPQGSQMAVWNASSSRSGALSDPGSSLTSSGEPITIYMPRKAEVSTFAAPILEQHQLMGQLIQELSPSSSSLPLDSLYTRSWLTFVHGRIGIDRSMDLAMRSLSCLHGGKKIRDARLINAGRSLYVDALIALRNSLAAGQSSVLDLQSSVMLLTLFELMSNRKEYAWIKHSGGAAEMIRRCGPQTYTSGYGHAMYLVCRAYIIIEAFVSERPCFLEAPAWAALGEMPNTVRHYLQEKMFACHAKAPRILRDFRRAAVGQHDMKDVYTRANKLRTELKICFTNWWEDLGPNLHPLELPSGDDRFPIAYHFSSTILMGLTCSHYTTLIILDQLLIYSGAPDVDHIAEECQISAVEICKCTAQASRGMMSSINMPFWLSVAAKGCAPEHYDWIMSKFESLRSMADVKDGLDVGAR